VRRSGDVIPTLDAVIAAAAGGAAMPPAGTWEWDSTETHIRATTATDAQVVAQLQHFFKILGVPSMGPSNCEALVKAGLKGPAAIAAASPERLGQILGPKTGAALYANLRTSAANATEITLMTASSSMPRGVGESKLKSLFDTYPDMEVWTRSAPPTGWTDTSFQIFLAALPAYRAWRDTEMGWTQRAIATAAPVKQAATGVLCFTGFREKDLEARAATTGFTVAAALSSKVNYLITPDPPKQAGAEKLAKAKANGTAILTRSEFIEKFLGNN
jgi:NAD-dependent DNA ligase